MIMTLKKLNFTGGLTMGFIIYFLWLCIVFVQQLMAYGTAYRYTKRGGDNGVSLFGWMLLFSLAAIIPGLGIWLWLKNKDE
jgi:hypothetical protein